MPWVFMKSSSHKKADFPIKIKFFRVEKKEKADFRRIYRVKVVFIRSDGFERK